MTNIDWSKAPEGATHYTRSKDAGYKWLKAVDGKVWYWADSHWSSYLAGSASRHLEESEVRPAPAVIPWTGEGLPPVGTVCEWHPNQDGWVQIEILGHDGEETWFRRAGESISETCLRMAFFRPIRTQEQIAAEEVQAIRDDIGYQRPQLGPCPVEQMYQLGYRKQVTP